MSSLTINMNPREVKCGVCGEWTEFKWGIPTYNGDIVSNDFPDHLYQGHGGNIAACLKCYTDHATGKMQTRDSWYVPEKKP